MYSSKPSRPSFVHWLRASGQITDEDLRLLSNEWNQTKPSGFKVYTTGPTTWDQFVASKYPRKVLAYHAYLRVIGVAPTLKKD